jgi:hypothetical protein
MTRDKFIAKAVRAAERALEVPPNWWGTWRDVTDGTVRVKFTGSCWRISCAGMKMRDHDSRALAIRQAARITRGPGRVR